MPRTLKPQVVSVGDVAEECEITVIEQQDEEEDVAGSSSATPSSSGSVITDMDRTRIVKAYLSGKKAKVIADIMDLPQRKVEVVIRNYSKTGRVKAVSGTAPVAHTSSSSTNTTSRSKISESQVEVLRMWASEDATLSGVQLTKRLNDTFNLNLSAAAVQRHLGPFIFSVNRISTAAETQNDPRTIALRKEYCQIYSDLPTMYGDTEVVYVGEMRFRLAIRDREGKGKLRLRNMSMCVALTKNEVVGYIGQNQPVPKEQFQEFVLSVVDELRRQGINSGVLILDECSLKDDSDTFSQMLVAKDYTSIFLPPHSPFLNPVESLFAELRDLFVAARTDTMSENMLVNLVIEGSKLIEGMDCERYVDSVMAYLPRCLDSEAIEVNDLLSIYAHACENEEDGRNITTEIVQEEEV